MVKEIRGLSEETTTGVHRLYQMHERKELLFPAINENDFFYYEDKFGGLKLPMPNVLGQYQLENISTAIATLRNLDLEIKDEHIKKGIKNISSLARLQEIKSGKLKELVKNNRFIVDGTHNEGGAKALNEYLQSLDCNKHVIIGMMLNKQLSLIHI